MLALVLLFTIVACGGTVTYPPASETITTWRTLRSTTTYVSTYTTQRGSYVLTTSTETFLRTLKGDLTTTFKNQQVNMTHEGAAHYPVGAWIFEVPIPPGTPTGYGGELIVTFNYRSSRNMTLEQIGIDGWRRIRTASETILTYYPLATIKVHEGTGSWSTWIGFIHSGATKEELVFMSREGFPEILSIDIAQVSEDVATATSTSLRLWSHQVLATITETIEMTYTKTKAYTTFETTTGKVTSPSATYVQPTTTVTTLTHTRTPSPIPGIDIVGFQVLIYAIIAVVVGSVVGLMIRRRRKAEAPYAPPTSPPPI